MASTSALPDASPRTSRSEETTPPFAAADGPSIERQLSPLSDGGFESKIRVGMSDVDAYGFLYYASYLKYNERATNHVSSGLVLRGLEFMKFAKSVLELRASGHLNVRMSTSFPQCTDLANFMNSRPRSTRPELTWLVARSLYLRYEA